MIVSTQAGTVIAAIVAQAGTIVIATQRLMVAVAVIVVPVVALTHAEMLVAVVDCWTEVVTPSVVVAATTIDVPGMSATIADVECRASEVEVVAHRIASVDAKVPVP